MSIRLSRNSVLLLVGQPTMIYGEYFVEDSVKYAGNNPAPRLLFSIADSADSEQISLSIKDNGTSIPLSDLPFVFDKGFTGDTGRQKSNKG